MPFSIFSGYVLEEPPGKYVKELEPFPLTHQGCNTRVKNKFAPTERIENLLFCFQGVYFCYIVAGNETFFFCYERFSFPPFSQPRKQTKKIVLKGKQSHKGLLRFHCAESFACARKHKITISLYSSSS